MLAHCKIVDVSVCASQAAARKAQPLWQQLGFQAKIYERKKNTMQYHASLITADGAYHCPLGSIIAIFESIMIIMREKERWETEMEW